MKKVVLLSLLSSISIVSFAQNVTIPDANFKAYLVGNTSINTNMDTEIQVTEAQAFTGILQCNSLSISDMTGVEAFTAITGLYACCNQLTTLDVSGLPNLTAVWCSVNQLTSLNVANGNNTNFTMYYFDTNPNLTCVQVDDAAYSTANWNNIDATASYSEDCIGLGVETKFNEKANIVLAPNPTTGTLTISQPADVRISSLNGQLLLSATNVSQIELASLPSGVYFCELLNNGNILQRERIVRQ